jgi:hypothetical protein
MLRQLRTKSIAHFVLAASMLAAVACGSSTSPIGRAAGESAEFGKTVAAPAATALVVSAANVTVGQAVTVTATLYTSGHPLGGKKLWLSVDGGAAVSAPATKLGTATWTLNGLAAGTHTLVASFAGGQGYSASSASTTVTVNP